MEYNFKLTEEEANRIVQALNNDAAYLISKMQKQFKNQKNMEEEKNEESN